MSTDPYDQYNAVASELAATSSTTIGTMFGMPCLKHNGKAFAGFHQGQMAFKLTTPQHSEALAIPGAHLFDPSERGRPMKEWVAVPAEYASQWMALARAAYEYVGR